MVREVKSGMFCPNHFRRKRAHKAGGSPGCRQHVTLTLMVPVEIRVKPGGLRGPRLSLETMVPARVARSGIRVRPELLAAAFRQTQSLRPRVGCGCGWSLDRLEVRASGPRRSPSSPPPTAAPVTAVPRVPAAPPPRRSTTSRTRDL